ncbi:hypothetical protein Taro_040966 [Colocasia esculenta]|uniref:Uncharacterized protein n=1 Tax=Colocasia esculenta TaxID=4460 RepID=A0A843WD53_COLES|nr:hypothetical protein [Colocasia esculenta]
MEVDEEAPIQGEESQVKGEFQNFPQENIPEEESVKEEINEEEDEGEIPKFQGLHQKTPSMNNSSGCSNTEEEENANPPFMNKAKRHSNGYGETGVPVLEDLAMASRGRRGAQARDDEHRREERGEQQAPTPHGPTVLPPPPPVDYSVFMQGLVQAMQTQAQTQAQALAPVPQEYGHGGPSIMERFKRMAPASFKGESQPLLVESWMREVEKIFWAIRCVEKDKVSPATYML